MRLFPTILASLATPFLLVACGADGSLPSAPTPAPDLAVGASRAAPLDPTHIYRFSLSCSAAAANSIVSLTTNGPINVLCGGGGTELGPGLLWGPFTQFDYSIGLDSPDGKVCSQAGVTTTGTFRCRSQKYSATLTVTDEGVPTW
jgi:hypothetical protein